MKKQSKIKTEWSSDFAYSIGVIATDGNLSPNKRSINITSKDIEMIKNIKSCLKINNRIGVKNSGTVKDKIYHVIQFGDKNFYDFLNEIGITANKSKTIGSLNIPRKFFSDFLRGCFDGDGNFSVSIHPESKIPQLRIRLCSASLNFVNWIKTKIKGILKINNGWIYTNKSSSMHILSYGKEDAGKILKFMYYNGVKHYLSRKYKIAKNFVR